MASTCPLTKWPKSLLACRLKRILTRFEGEHQKLTFTYPRECLIRPLAQHSTHTLRSHHHVESVHFTTPKNVLLHPALAVVQTPAREYIILRDNGMQVGCEEDGVANVWMHVLGCDENGVAVGCAG